MGEPLKILFLTTTDDQAATFLRSWFYRLSAQEAEVSLATTVAYFRDELEEAGAQVLDLSFSSRPSLTHDLASVIDLVYLIGRLRPDVVHTHSVRAGFLGRLAAWLCAVPVVIHTVRSLPSNGTAWAMEWLAARWCHHLVAVSEQDFEQVARRLAPRRKLSLIRDGISPHDFAPRDGSRERVRRKLGLEESEPLVGLVVEPGTRILESLQERRPEVHLGFLGLSRPDPEEPRVHHLPWGRSGPDVLAALDIFVLTSAHRELHPLLLGIMQLGKPVISLVPTEVIRPGVDGLVCSESDLDETVEFLLSHPEEAVRLGAAARERVESVYDDSESKSRLWSLYHNLWSRYRSQVD